MGTTLSIVNDHHYICYVEVWTAGCVILANQGIVKPGQTLKLDVAYVWYDVKFIYKVPGGDKTEIKKFATLLYAPSGPWPVLWCPLGRRDSCNGDRKARSAIATWQEQNSGSGFWS